MLVPWTEKTLTRQDKVIVFVTFLGLAITGQEILTPESTISNHLAYIAQFFSYAIGNPIGFRIIAMVSSLLEIIGDLVESEMTSSDAIPIFYNLLFFPINAYYVLRWLLNQEALQLSEDEEVLFLQCFAPLGFSRGQFSRLLARAQFEAVPLDDLSGPGVTLCTEGEPLKDLFVSVNGTLDVFVGGVVATTIPPYQVIGESALLENLQSKGGKFHLPARSTIVAEPGAAYMRWSQRTLYELKESDPEIAYTIQLMIARTLSLKLQEARLSQQRATKDALARAEKEATHAETWVDERDDLRC